MANGRPSETDSKGRRPSETSAIGVQCKVLLNRPDAYLRWISLLYIEDCFGDSFTVYITQRPRSEYLNLVLMIRQHVLRKKPYGSCVKIKTYLLNVNLKWVQKRKKKCFWTISHLFDGLELNRHVAFAV